MLTYSLTERFLVGVNEGLVQFRVHPIRFPPALLIPRQAFQTRTQPLQDCLQQEHKHRISTEAGQLQVERTMPKAKRWPGQCGSRSCEPIV